MQVTPDLLRALGVRDAAAVEWAGHIDAACQRHAINTRLRIAAFLANVLEETGNLTRTVESLDYTPERLIAVWPGHFGPSNAYQLGRTADHPADQKGIAEVAYGNRLGNGPAGSGDGWLYRGRGLIQLTGRSNYSAFASKIGVPLADLPTLLQLPAGAAESAAAFWESAVCNVLADRGDIEGVRRTVNGGTNGLETVKAIYAKALGAIPEAAEPPPAPTPPPASQPAPRPSLWALALGLFTTRKGA